MSVDLKENAQIELEASEKTLGLKSINQLRDYQFFIPSYQRGYRWTKQQVEDLLNDLDAFVPLPIAGRPGEETIYCLQPVVIKTCNEKDKVENNLEGDWYEVIDGQQRLTTLFLIMHYANQMWTGRQKNKEIRINYKTRANCVKFLEQITVEEDYTVNIDKSYIDYYYISSAYNCIHDWVKDYPSKKGKPFDEDKFKTKFNTSTQIIWYKVSENEVGSHLFDRLNMGKIALTNSELVKALFLSSESFPDLSIEEQYVKRIEIARLWDEIEQKLNEPDSRFWSFITNKKRESFATKIELLLDMIANKSYDETDPLATFLYFYKKGKKESLSDIWNQIEQYFFTLLEWSKDKDLYHKVGYLITAKSKVSLKELVSKSVESTKTDFDIYLNSIISDTVKVEIKELRYENDYDQIQNLLLLFNTETIRTSKSVTEFYPFKEHKDTNWSIEHIHARNSLNLDQNKKDTWLEWLSDHKKVLLELQDNDHFNREGIQLILNEIEQFNNKQITWERFSQLFNSINNIFVDDKETFDRESEGILNLALLSQPDNSSLNNAVFEVKRREIIKMDKEGSYIPICTRRAFLKYYNKDDQKTQYYFWHKNDRENYGKAITDLLVNYLPKTNNIQDENL